MQPNQQDKIIQMRKEKYNKYMQKAKTFQQRKNQGAANNQANPKSKNQQTSQAKKVGTLAAKAMKTNRGEAMRAGRRNFEAADKQILQWNVFEKHHEHQGGVIPALQNGRLRLTILGGLEGIGEKNMSVLEYGDDALIIDCGFDLAVDLPGVNFAIPATEYLDTIKHKIRAYVITHGHMDHTGGLPHILPKYPAPLYGSHFTMGIVKQQFENAKENGIDFDPEVNEMFMDNHQRMVVGPFTIEFVRITHSIPDASAVIIDTPVGRVVDTGDFRIDPEPLDKMPTDTERLIKAGQEGVLLLMSDSTNARYLGRVNTESTLQESFNDIFKQSYGRIFVAIFSTNMNRIQMIVNSAAAAGRKVAFDGRSMMWVAELAVRLGNLKIPKGTVIPMREAPNVKDDQLVVICTGGQGEPNAALQRMSIGEHKHIKLKEGDTVVVSSSPIPGNEVRYQQIGNDLAKLGVKIFRHPSRDVDGCGPLHVSGHAHQDEMADMIEMVRPKWLMPVHGGALDRKYHANAGENAGMSPREIIQAHNGSIIEFDKDGNMFEAGEAPAGAVLVDQTGAIVPGLVAKDRLLMGEEGMVVAILTLDQKSGRLLTSPDIITRGFIYIRDNAELMDGLRAELKRAAAQRYGRIEIDRFKQELKDHITHYLYEHTKRNPIVIPVVNIIGANGKSNVQKKPQEHGC